MSFSVFDGRPHARLDRDNIRPTLMIALAQLSGTGLRAPKFASISNERAEFSERECEQERWQEADYQKLTFTDLTWLTVSVGLVVALCRMLNLAVS